jgi:hypothetical protein
MRLAYSSESYDYHRTEPIELARLRLDLRISTGLHGFPSSSVPRFLAIPGSSSPELRLLSRVPSPLFTRPLATATERLPGISLSIATSTRGVHHSVRISTLPLFRPQCFSHSRRLAPPMPCGLVSSHCHVRDYFSGIFPSNQLAWLITSLCPLVVLQLLPAVGLPRLRQFLLPRLQGFCPVAGPLSSTGVLRLPMTRSPLKFSAPWVFLRTPWERLHIPSTHDLSCRFLV